MKRTLAIVVLCMLLLATVGTTAAVAAKSPKSPIYQFNVLGIDGTAKGEASGKLSVNTNANTYVFNGRHGVPGTEYYLYYYTTSADDKIYIDSGTADANGNVSIAGPLPTLPAGDTWKDVTGAYISTTPPFKAVLYAWFGLPTPDSPPWATAVLYLNPWDSTGGIQSAQVRAVSSSQTLTVTMLGWPPHPELQEPIELGGAWTPGVQMTVTLTIYDGPNLTGNSDTSMPIILTVPGS